LQGVGKPLLGALQALDLRIRDNQVNFYSADKSLLKVTPTALALHHKYATGCDFLGATKDKGGYLSLKFTEASVAQVIQHLPSILKNVQRMAGDEGIWEEALVHANTQGTPLVVVDRQVRRPGNQSRLDLVAVTTDEKPMLVAIELKRGEDNRIQDVPKQLHRYLEMLDRNGDGLSADFAEAYATACGQMTALGRQGPNPKLIRAGMPVRGLLILADYPVKSKLLERARVCARALPRPMFFWMMAKRHLAVPVPEKWEALK
jgi:hypothetical protein